MPAFREISTSVSVLRSLLSSYDRIRSLSPSQTSLELTQARSELESNAQDLCADLQDLIESLKAVEGDPFRYGLDIVEVGRRRELVQDQGREVDAVIRELKICLAQDVTAKGQNLPPLSSVEPEIPDAKSEYAALQQQRQVEIMQEQDDALDDVLRTVGTLKQQADDMGREFEEQDEMLEEVGNIGDRLDGKLRSSMKKVDWVIKKNEGKFFARTDRITG